MSEEPSTKSACPHPEAVGTRWGDDIDDDRKGVLKKLTEKQREWVAKPETERGDSAFQDVELTGADVFWLAEQVRKKDDISPSVPDLHLEGANLHLAHLEEADLGGAHLEGADMGGAHLEGGALKDTHLEQVVLELAHLEGADLIAAHLEGADLIAAHLEGANVGGAFLEGAAFQDAHLERANLHAAHLERADLGGAFLQGAGLRVAHLEGAGLRVAHLEGAYLLGTHLEGRLFAADNPEDARNLARIRQWTLAFPAILPPADMSGAFCDAATMLNDVVLVEAQFGAVQVADMRWGGVNLAVVPDWAPFTEQRIPLGDERVAWASKPKPFTETEEERKRARKERVEARREYDATQARERLDLFQTAVRANRQLATALRSQGMNEQADYFAYRAQVVQRAVLSQQGKRVRAFGSWLLDRVAGYGYQPMRSVVTYLLVVGLFAVAYFFLGGAHGQALSWNEALVVSLTAFHGRGFFATAFQPGDPQAALAALEAVIGLLIEITFIATFTQRFFAR